MTRYKNCRMLCAFMDGSGIEELTCNVTLDEKQIAIDYFYDGEASTWRGKEVSPGHYSVWDVKVPGSSVGTLHCMPNSNILEGTWVETAEVTYKGFWEIRLGKEEG
jgi:hypothetical protein